MERASKMASKYEDKNRRRKEGKSVGSVNERMRAKQLRKMVRGAFGTTKEAFQHECLPGTTGQVSENVDTTDTVKKGKRGGVTV